MANIKYIMKRDGEVVSFDQGKIEAAIMAAVVATPEASEVTAGDVHRMADNVVGKLSGTPSVEDVQELVEDELIAFGNPALVKAYIRYRFSHGKKRALMSGQEESIKALLAETSKDNANVSNGHSGKMLQIAEEAVKAFALKNVFSAEASEAHQNGDIYIHDLGHSLSTVNCLQLPFADMLQNGFHTGHGFIRRPKRISSAAALAAIALQSSQNDMFGGQSIPNFDSAMAPFVGDATEREVYQAMESLVFNLNTMHSRAGAQVPFSSLNFGLDMTDAGRMVSRNLLLAYEAGLGNGELPLFPNILFKVKDGVNRRPSDPNYDIFCLAMKVASKRMNPTFVFCDAECNAVYAPESVNYMGCRTRVASNVNGREGSEGRGNLFSVAINLPRLALKARDAADTEKAFFGSLKAMLDLCVRHLLERFELCSKLKVKDLPFVMGQHLYLGSEELGPNDSILPALRNGTMTVGFIGLAEALVALTGKHHGESAQSEALGHRIIGFMKDAMDAATAKYRLNFSVFATPAEGLSGKFVEKDRKVFGEIPGVTDRDYYTNSFHVPVYYPISHAEKMRIEGAFHKQCLGGHIAYVEFDGSPSKNLGAVEALLNLMSDSGVGYAGINFPIDRCECGFEGVIDGDKCPVCRSTNIKRFRRITGYLSELGNFNAAKKSEAMDRTSSHVD